MSHSKAFARSASLLLPVTGALLAASTSSSHAAEAVQAGSAVSARLVVVTGSRTCGPGGFAPIPQGFGRADFTQACASHDICYSPNSSTARVDCDVRFYWDMANKCSNTYPPTGRWLDRNLWIRNACKGAAFDYYAAVRNAGWAFYSGHGSNW